MTKFCKYIESNVLFNNFYKLNWMMVEYNTHESQDASHSWWWCGHDGRSKNIGITIILAFKQLIV